MKGNPIITLGNITIKPLSPSEWQDFERLFGPKGAYGGCWCMWWRCTRNEFTQNQGDNNRLAMKALVESGKSVGLLAYENEVPIGWCSIAPREDYDSLGRSRILKPVDDQKVWSLVCFYIQPKFRNLGVSEVLIKGAIEFVKLHHGTIIEAYPTVV